VNRFTQQTLPTINRKHFFMNFLPIGCFCPHKNTHNRRCYSVVNFSSTVAISTTEHGHAHLLPKLSWSWTVLLSSDTQKTYYVHYSCFISICDLFTDSPSYIFQLSTCHSVKYKTWAKWYDLCSK
jgi:hypothetical protein